MHSRFSPSKSVSLLAACFAAVASVNGRDICHLTASGGDDAPQFLAAAASCGTVTIPEGTTLNISTRLNMTAMSNFKIVGVCY